MARTRHTTVANGGRRFGNEPVLCRFALGDPRSAPPPGTVEGIAVDGRRCSMHRFPIRSTRLVAIAVCLTAAVAAGAYAQPGLVLNGGTSTINACRLAPKGWLRAVD
ncbi:MAG: hypothetical protein ACRDO9_07025, partial [Gaiellales bacterium]